MTFLHSGYNSKINLSAKDMLEISQEISRDFTPCFSSRMPERVKTIRLSPRELLDIGEEIGRNFAPKVSYKASELMLLPVDPGHLYAYWHLDEKQQTLAPAPIKDCDEQLTLRIYSQPEQDNAAKQTPTWFDVAIDSPKNRQQVSLPSPVDETAYSAAIGKCCADDSFITFAHSNLIHTFHGRTAWRQDAENPAYHQGKSASGQGISK